MNCRHTSFSGITVLIDEIFISSRVEYFNGQYFGTDGDSVTKKLCFMLKSVCSPYCDVVAMYPEGMELERETIQRNQSLD